MQGPKGEKGYEGSGGDKGMMVCHCSNETSANQNILYLQGELGDKGLPGFDGLDGIPGDRGPAGPTV